MFLVINDHPKLFLDKFPAIGYIQKLGGTMIVLSSVGRIGVETVLAWRVETPHHGSALFLERSKAIQYSADHHGTFYPLFKDSST